MKITGLVLDPNPLGRTEFVGLIPGDDGSLVEFSGTGAARFTGRLVDALQNITFDVVLNLSGLGPASDPPFFREFIPLLTSCTNTDFPSFPDWLAYTTWSGTATGQPGSKYDGVVYELTGTSPFEIGHGADYHSIFPGIIGNFDAELASNPNNEAVPTGPTTGSIKLNIQRFDFIPFASFVGTWDAINLDCIGERGTTAAFLTNSSTPSVLEMDGVNARVDGGKVLCANTPVTPGSATGVGQLSYGGDNTFAPQAILKYDAAGDKIRLRYLRSVGMMEGVDFCKGEYIRRDALLPAIPTDCRPQQTPEELCAVANQGTIAGHIGIFCNNLSQQ